MCSSCNAHDDFMAIVKTLSNRDWRDSSLWSKKTATHA
jgi:hypothetical protein